jgi:hypothetical protein
VRAKRKISDYLRWREFGRPEAVRVIDPDCVYRLERQARKQAKRLYVARKGRWNGCAAYVEFDDPDTTEWAAAGLCRRDHNQHRVVVSQRRSASSDPLASCPRSERRTRPASVPGDRPQCAHLGVETQRQWSDNAILRTTPALLALFSIVTLWSTIWPSRRNSSHGLPRGIQNPF